MANNWDEFFAAPIKASKKLHVTAADVKRGAQIDARRREAERLVAEQNRTTPTGLPYGVTPRPSGVPSDAPRMYEGDNTKTSPTLVNDALAKSTLAGAGLTFGLNPLVGFRAGLVGSSIPEALIANATEDAEIPAAMASAGMLGRRALPVALATGAAYAADAEAGGVLKQLLQGVYRGYAGERRPTIGALGSEMYFTSPQKRVADYYATRRAAETGEAPHVDMLMVDPFNTKYQSYSLGLPADKYNPSHDAVVTRARRVDPEEVVDTHQLYAGGGLVKSGLKMMFPNLSAPLHVVKPKGGNWLSGSVEDALGGLRYPDPAEVRNTAMLPEITRNQPLNSWIEGPLTKYVKTRMASPDDEVRRLADEGVLHFEPLGIRDQSPIMRDIVEARTQGGFAPQGYAGSPLGAQWEKYADSAIDPRKVRDFTGDQRTIYEPGNEWMKKAPSDTPVYRTDPNNIGTRAVENLGFNHLIDELSNALNPNSGLPPHLQLSPEAVKQMSMEKAVRRVADINAWRAAQKVEANRALAEQAALVRDYPHSEATPNPKGLRWVELKKSTDELPEGYRVLPNTTYLGKTGYQLVDSSGSKFGLPQPTEAEALAQLEPLRGRRALEDQLKYEGDTMGHCVGRYCDDVFSGRSRIFSLRDAKGEPHVTVETAPKWNGKMGGESTTDQAILQIKGKQNRAPNPEYLPFVQDFVKNPPHGQPWGDVGDLQNSGLRRTRDALNDLEQKILREKGQEFGDYLSDAEIQALQAQFSSNGGKLASGGSVGAPATGWGLLTGPTGSPEENKLSWDIFSGHNDPEQLEAVQ